MIIQLVSKFPAVVDFTISSNFSTNQQLDPVPHLFGLLVVDFITTISAFYGNTLHYIICACSLPCLRHPSVFNNPRVPHEQHKVICKYNEDANFFTIHLPHSFFHSFVHSFIYSSIHQFIHLPIHPFIHSFFHPSTHFFFHSSIQPSIHSFILYAQTYVELY